MRRTWSAHHYLVAAARKVWRWSPEHRQAGKACAMPGDKRKCAACDKVYPRREVHIDHMEAVGKQPRTWEEYPAYYKRLFCPVSNLQGLCIFCHKLKTRMER